MRFGTLLERPPEFSCTVSINAGKITPLPYLVHNEKLDRTTPLCISCNNTRLVDDVILASQYN